MRMLKRRSTNCGLLVLLLLVPVTYTASSGSTPDLLFNPSKSSSFYNHLFASFAQFQNAYVDGSSIAGYICKDVLQFGHGSAKVFFGCANIDKSAGDWDYDGILGMGLHDKGTIVLNTPLFFSLCDNGSIKPCVFSVLLTDKGGEVQLGGYVPESIYTSTLVYAPVTSPCSESKLECDIPVAYTIDIQQISISTRTGNITLYIQPSSPIVSDETLVTIVDSGVSCTLLPTAVTTSSGETVDIYSLVRQNVGTNSQLFININGVDFPIPLSDCYTQNSETNLLTLGDPFFRTTLVIHDLSQKQAQLGFALQRPGYTSSAGGVISPQKLRSSDALLDPKSYHTLNETTGISVLSLWKQTNAPPSKRTPATNGTVEVITDNQNIYFTVLSAGTPRQSPFIVQLDTGSALTAIFSKGAPRAPAWQIALFSLAIFAVVAGIAVGCFFFFKKNELAFEK